MYTIHIFHSLTFKNKLHKELYQFFEEIEHAVFDDLDQMKELITNKVEHLNTEHKRCKPIKISFDEVDRYDKKIYIFGLSALGNIHILKLRDFKNTSENISQNAKTFIELINQMAAEPYELKSFKGLNEDEIQKMYEDIQEKVLQIDKNRKRESLKDIFGIGKTQEPEISTITPIRCHTTKELLHIGDNVKNERGQYGYLAWDEVFNRYHIRTESGGSVKGRLYTKVEEIQPNNIDTTKVECRRNPNKKKF